MAAQKIQQVGNSTLLMEISALMERWGITKQASYKLLRALRIPLIYLGPAAYFNFYGLEKAIYYLSRHGGPGFAAPGTEYRNKGRHKEKVFGDVRIELTAADMKIMASASFIAEWMAIGPKNSKPAAVAQYTQAITKEENARAKREAKAAKS